MASALQAAVRPPLSKAKHASSNGSGVTGFPALQGEARAAAEAWVAFVFEAAGGSGKRLLPAGPALGGECLWNGNEKEAAAAAAAANTPLVSEEAKEARRVEAKKDYYEQLRRLNGSEPTPSTPLLDRGADAPSSSSSSLPSLPQRVPRLYTYSELEDLDRLIKVEERIHRKAEKVQARGW